MTQSEDAPVKQQTPVTGLFGVGLGLAAAILIGVFPSCTPEAGFSNSEPMEQAQPTQHGDATTAIQTEGFGGESDHQAGNVKILKRELVVKFHNLAEADAINEQFWTNKVAAQKAFLDLQSDYAFLEGSVLVRATYSGELVLGLLPTKAETPEETKIRFEALAERLSDQPFVAYAEPNVIVRPGQADH